MIAALASEAAPPQPTDLRYFVGRWNVVSKDPASGEVLRVIYSVKAPSPGTWLIGASAATDGSLSARDVWGVDPLTGEVMRMVFDGAGTFATVRSRGWTGDRIVLEGEARSKGGTVRVRETIFRLSPRRFKAVWEAYRKGAWSTYALETVTRA